MIESVSNLLHFGTIAFTVSINAIAAALSGGLASRGALQAIDTQPAAQQDIARVALIGMALIETAAVLGVTTSFFLLFVHGEPTNIHAAHIAEVGIALALCISGFVISLASSFPVREACDAIARQPFFTDKILRFMLVTQSIIQTPIIFGFIIAMFIRAQALTIENIAQSLMLIAAGLCIGLGSIGPTIGLANFAKNACRGLGVNRKAYNQLLTFTFISQAIIETPIIFSLTVSLIILFYKSTPTLIASCSFLAAALCMGLGTLGPGIASGKTASAAVKQIALNPQHYASISKTSMFGQGLIDTSAIYAFLIASLLVFIT